MNHPTDPTPTVTLSLAELRRLQEDAREFMLDAADDDDEPCELSAEELHDMLMDAVEHMPDPPSPEELDEWCRANELDEPPF